MKELGYGRGYRYDPSEPEGVAPQEYLPDGLRGEVFYHPSGSGAEKAIAERLRWWAERRSAREGGAEPAGGEGRPPE
jgi:putative ATPase